MQSFAEEAGCLGRGVTRDGHIAQVEHGEGVELVVRIFRVKALQVRLGRVELAVQKGGFACAEQGWAGKPSRGFQRSVLLKLPAGFVETFRLPQRLAEKERTLMRAAVVGILLQKDAELFHGEFPLPALVLAGRDGELIVGLVGPGRCGGQQQHASDSEEDRVATDRCGHQSLPAWRTSQDAIKLPWRTIPAA